MATVAGIDIGAEVIKGVVLSKKSTGPIQMVAAGTQPIGELGHLQDGPDKLLAIGEKLKGLVRTAHLKADVRRVGIGGNQCTVRYLQVPPVPPWRLDMLVKYEIDEKGGNQDEAQTFDYRILDVPEVAGQYTVLIGAVKETVANDLLAMGKNSDLGEVQIDIEALALYNAYYHGHGFDTDKTVLVVDIGADDITILLVKNGSLYFGRSMLGGGRRFTQALAEELKIDLLEAEELKIKHSQILFDQVAQPSAGRTGRIARPGMTGVLPRPAGLSGTSLPASQTQSRTPSASIASTKPSNPAPFVKPTASTASVPSAPSAPSTASMGAASLPETLSLDMSDALDLSLSSDPTTPTPSTATAAAEPESVNRTNPNTNALPDIDASLPNLVANSSVSSLALDVHETSTSESISSPANPSLLQVSDTAEPADINKEATRHQMLMAISQSAKISTVLVREAASLCAMLENAILTCRQQYKLRELKVDRAYLCGGSSQLKGLSEFITRRMRMEVLPLEPLKQISLDRLPPAQTLVLKAEQHRLAIAVGLAIGEIEKGAISFVLIPEAVKQRKIFWARGAYAGYAAALAILTLGLLLYTPIRNTNALAANDAVAQKGVVVGKAERRANDTLVATNTELRQRYKQIYDNTESGNYFSTVLSELRDPKRIPPEIYLTSISTTAPALIKGSTPNRPIKNTQESLAKAAKENTEPDTFQAQRLLYIRGIARCADKLQLDDKIIEFKKRLVPHPEDPDHPDNLFKDIKSDFILGTKDIQEGGYALQEFILVAYTSTPETTATPKTEKTTPAVPVTTAPKKELPKNKFNQPSEQQP